MFFSGIFYNDILQEFSHMVGSIGRFFQFLHDFLCFHEFDTVGLFIEQLHDEQFIDFIGAVLYLMELLAVCFQPGRVLAEGFQFVHGFADKRSSLLNEHRQLFSAFRNDIRVVDGNSLGCTVDTVCHIVDG